MTHTFFCIDAHTCGNPVRMVTGGAPFLRGTTMAEKRAEFVAKHDWVRKSLMFEPRGHDAMSGTILYPTARDDCDLGWIFIEVSGCLPMCGHGTIGTITAAIEHGLVTPRTPGRLVAEVPAGRIEVEYTMSECGRFVDNVRLFNVSAYLHAQNVEIDVPRLGKLSVDLSYGGNYYVIIEPQDRWSGLDDMNVGDIVELSPVIRQLVQDKVKPVHPEDPAIYGVSHVMWTDEPKHPEATSRNAVFFGEKGIDRSPCGTGTSSRMAQLHAKDQLKVGEDFVHESYIGTLFNGRIEGIAQVGGQDAIRPSVAGWARVTGLNTIFVDQRDPLWQGFQVF